MVILENNRKLINKCDIILASGDYVWAFGNIVVSKLSKQKAENIRSIFKNAQN